MEKVDYQEVMDRMVEVYLVKMMEMMMMTQMMVRHHSTAAPDTVHVPEAGK